MFGTVLTSRMQDTLSHDAAHTLAGGGAGALRGALSEQTLRAAFASGLNSASLAAGVTGLIAGALVLVLVRTPRAVTGGAEKPVEQQVGADLG